MQAIDGRVLRLRKEQLRLHLERLGVTSDSAIATHLGISQATVLRMFAEEDDTRKTKPITPGERIIVACLHAFPHLKFEDLFEIVREPAEQVAA